VIITAEPITDIDATAEQTLLTVHDELRDRGIELGFAELKGVVRDQLERSGTVEIIGRENFHPTVGRAVRAYVRTHVKDWIDWQDADG
jgi:MFS superfamily sulfate permease-like transporter